MTVYKFMLLYSSDRKVIFWVALIGILFAFEAHLTFAQKTLAFPGAEGFGKYSQGGRGGEVIKVTNLNDKGPGSLRNALEAEGPRIVVFEAGGLIDLETPIKIDNPYITIAGQTAPGDGIAIRGNRIIVATNNVIIRFLRVRPGDRSFGPENNWESLDAITIGEAKDRTMVHDVVLDHCSLSWATDEVYNIGSGVRNITIQNSIISEGLNLSKHPEGYHSKGILIKKNTDRISVLNNFLIHNARRNPKLNTTGLVDIRNNVIYNPDDYGVTLVNTEPRAQRVNLVHNFFYRGPDTDFEHEVSIYKPEIYNGKIFMEGNSGFGSKRNKNNWSMLDDKHGRESLKTETYSSYKSEKEFYNTGVKPKDRNEILNFINNHVGASLPIRDQVDKRLIKDFNNRTGRIIDSQAEAGGWPVYLNASPLKDTDDNGIPDTWMEKYGILPGEENMDFDNDGYLNIEEYLNGTDPTGPNNTQSEVFSSSTLNGLEYSDFSLEQNYPNPFNSDTKVRFRIPNGNIQIYIYDIVGRRVKTLLDRNLSSGEYEMNWSPDRDLSSGTFFLRIIHEGRIKSVPMTYVK